MECINCDVKFCEESINSNVKCKTCGCNSKGHFKMAKFDNYQTELIEFYKKYKNVERALGESKYLAKSFGLCWLPIGIQPSEVDQFLKCFSHVENQSKSILFKKTVDRCKEMLRQLPSQDRYLNQITNTEEKIKYWESRLASCLGVGRVDHLDKPEGDRCFNCKQTISFGEICVLLNLTSTRGGQTTTMKYWHPACFKCGKCNSLLIDYHFCINYENNSSDNESNSDQILCLRDFAETCLSRCGFCDELIASNQCLCVSSNSNSESIKQYFHSNHLFCYMCSQPIATTDEITRHDLTRFLCNSCSTSSTSICLVCNTRIEDINNHTRYHKQCSKCHFCDKRLYDDSGNNSTINFHRYRNGYIVCLSCQLDTNIRFKCTACCSDVDLDSERTQRTGHYLWHFSAEDSEKNCLKCCKCQINLIDQQLLVINIDKSDSTNQNTLKSYRPICLQCYRADFHQDLLCCVCNNKVHNESVLKYQDRIYHEKCFNCCQCNTQLSPVKFIQSFSSSTDDKSAHYCLDCGIKKLSKQCTYCSQPIIANGNDSQSDNQMLCFDNKYWHCNCFICSKCNCNLRTIGFLQIDDKLYCVGCQGH